MKRRVRRRIAGLFGAAILLLACMAGLRLVGYRNTSRLVQTDRQIAHSQTILDRLHQVYSALQEAEAAERGYLLAGDVQFLQTYRGTAGTIPGQVTELSSLLKADPDQAQQLRKLIGRVDRELADLENAVGRRNSGAADARAQVNNTDRGERSMLAIRDSIRTMESQEVRTMTRRAATASDSSRESMLWFLTLSGVDLLLLVSGFVLLNRHMSRRERAEERAGRLNEDLQRKNEELRAAQEQMRLAKEAAEEANRSKDQFLATVTHELRSPLSAILLWARVARNNAPAQSPDLAEALDGIEKAARTQSHLVEDLLDVSRMVHGKLRVRLGPLDLRDVARASFEDHRLAARAREIDLKAELGEADIPVLGDEHRLRQVIGNLLSNAIKFTPAGGRVRLTAGCADGNAYIRVEDTGKGISAEFLPHLFERFTQADPTVARERTGLGLGLAIVQHIVQLHGGSVSASSEGLGRGSTFTVVLPCSAFQKSVSGSAAGEAGGRAAPSARRNPIVVGRG
ncbi:MAG TPA: ATP-binding protein [Tepidisphaeraceae bacterium]|nr:ATP-binding protein [Tepidisphaeraceae bacterium]